MVPWLFPYASKLGTSKFIGFTDTAGIFTTGEVGLFTLIELTSETFGGSIVNVFTSGVGALIVNFGLGGFISTPISGAPRVIEIEGASTGDTPPGFGVSGTFILIGFNVGRSILGAVIGSVTFKLIFGRTTSLGISIFGFIAISSLNTDFGRTFAIIWISTSGS